MKHQGMIHEGAIKLAKELGLDPKKIQMPEMEGTYEGERGTFFTVAGKKNIYINPTDMDLINQLRKLPVATRVKIMALSEEELEKHLIHERTYTRTWLLEVLTKDWYYRETGDPADDLTGLLPGTPLGQKQLLKFVKRGSRMTRTQMQDIINWFLNDRAEVYTKD